VDETQQIRFHTKGGVLTCTRDGELIELDFPATPAHAATPLAGLLEALGVQPSFFGRSSFDTLVVVESEQTVRSLTPDVTTLRNLPIRGVIVTDRSADPRFDFVSRFFSRPAPELMAFQVPARDGIVRVRVNGDRVILAGQVITVLRGTLTDQASGNAAGATI
jgi:predicted PhzF superfamily epimerase YddE/YHI9